MKMSFHRDGKKYVLIVRKVHNDKFLVQLFTVVNKKKEMKIYGLYDTQFDIEKGLRGKKKPQPWQGDVKYDIQRPFKIY
jgi:hypothetical protein